jgi:hypothetical protein
MSTVGYGDVLPSNSPEKLLAMVGMALGVTVFTYFMGAMTSVLDTLNASDAQVRGLGGGGLPCLEGSRLPRETSA